jgi:N-dimethylarginine dimethylaminohydrolase
MKKAPSPRKFGSQSMIARLRSVLVKRPDESFAVEDPTKWNYSGRPDLAIAQQEHDAFVDILRQDGVEVAYHDEAQPERSDAIYVHDPALITDRGAVILSMGKTLRQGEEETMARCLQKLGVPVMYKLHGEARSEGGDLLWLDHDTLAVGLGFRTNHEGLRQLEKTLSGIDIIPVELPYYHGPRTCLHLMSLINIVDHMVAVIYPPFLSAPFWQRLRDLGFRLIHVPTEEFETMGTNVLALTPGRCLMLEGNPITRRRLQDAGCEVLTYKGNEISLKAEGGPTCLTRPILRKD